MFERVGDRIGSDIAIFVDGREVSARPGDTVAAALMSAGVEPTRLTPVSGSPRAPYCMMGVCFECLVTIDGVGNRQACLVPVSAGMRVETGKGKREAGH